MNQTPPVLIMVVTDGSKNSVFTSQVLAPLRQRANQKHYQEIIVVSFEQKKWFSSNAQEQAVQHEDDCTIRIIYLPRPSLIPLVSSWWCTWQLHQVLQKISTPYHLLCRGALAALIAQRARTQQCQQLQVQARGLMAEEYWLSMQNKSWLYTCITYCRYYHYKSIEWRGYHKAAIEAVSPALSTYLTQNLKIKPATIDIAAFDFPYPLAAATRQRSRQRIRELLGISPEDIVLVYSGSIAAWQDTDLVYRTCNQWLGSQPQGKILLLTPQPIEFQHALTQYYSNTPKFLSHYLIRQVSAEEHIHYLAAGDIGLLVREPHIVNWVSRPTKILEYQAAGLQILHNNTVEWVIQLVGKCAELP